MHYTIALPKETAVTLVTDKHTAWAQWVRRFKLTDITKAQYEKHQHALEFTNAFFKTTNFEGPFLIVPAIIADRLLSNRKTDPSNSFVHIYTTVLMVERHDGTRIDLSAFKDQAYLYSHKRKINETADTA